MVVSLPLLTHPDLAAPLAWRNGRAISAGLFIAQAQALAALLPAQGQPINLCQDRYHFALCFAAALLRGQTSLMPPNALPQTLAQLQAGGAAYVLGDELPASHLPAWASLRPARVVPLISSDLNAVCLLTSGSTGPPQPHHKTWGSLVANIGAQSQRLAELLQRPNLQGLNIVATVPAQHSYGFESSLLLALLSGAAFAAGRPFYPADIAQALAEVPAPRALVSTPFHLKTLLLSGLALPVVALTMSATAPLSPQLAHQTETALTGPLIEIYGCTEAGQVASRRTTAGEVWTTLGALHIVCEPGADNRGETFVVSGGHVSQPTPLADVLELIDSRHFRLLGRANDLIHVAGKRSSLAHLNFHLNRIDGVEDGAFWLPDANRADPADNPEAVVRPLVLVVAPQLSAAQVIAALRLQIEAVFVPRRVLFVPALPRESTGKLTAQALRDCALRALQVQPAAPANKAGKGPWRSDFHIATEHPAFAGHFPGQPVLPGVLLLALVQQSLQQHAAHDTTLLARQATPPRIDQVKFLSPVLPDTRLCVVLREHGTGLAFEVLRGSQAVARGQLAGPAR